jgi:hypothetical protein
MCFVLICFVVDVFEEGEGQQEQEQVKQDSSALVRRILLYVNYHQVSDRASRDSSVCVSVRWLCDYVAVCEQLSSIYGES